MPLLRGVRSRGRQHDAGCAGNDSWKAVHLQSGRPDLNRGPPAPEAGALTGLRYAPQGSLAGLRCAGGPRAARYTHMRSEGLEPPTF